MILKVELSERSYDVVIERGAIERASEYLSLQRKVLIVTDSGVPKEYAEAVASACGEPHLVTLQMGEEAKCFENYRKLLSEMLRLGFTRSDCVVAVGGGVVGDLAGFVAASYMRGVDFYNVPTTLLSQIDSSIGGKVAIDLDGIKNIVGAFYQPKKVLIDPEVLKTLEMRQFRCGLAEAVKMSMTSDKELFEIIENSKDISADIDTIIHRSLLVKKNVVEKDEKESGLRRVLNFGHTLGHGIEAASDLYHGECVGMGMLPMCSSVVKKRLISLMKKIGLPLKAELDVELACKALSSDKKADGSGISCVIVNEIGSFEIKKMTSSELEDRLKANFDRKGCIL